jgi:hypothetical protein
MFKICPFLLSVMMLNTCNKETGACESFKKVPAALIEGPDAGTVNQVITVTVSFAVFNGCGQFGRFEETTTGNTKKISIIAKYSGCICTDDIPTRKATYKFTAVNPGVYYLQFSSSDSTYLIDTLTVK